MARTRNGALGGYRGKLGNTIGQVYHGIEVVRAYPQSVYNPDTPAQQIHRELITNFSKLFSTVNGLISASLWQKNNTYNAFNNCMKYNFSKAVNNSAIDFKKVVFGEFDRSPLKNFTSSIVLENGKYYFDASWVCVDDGYKSLEGDDIVLVCVIQYSGGEFDVIKAGTTALYRDDEACKLELVSASKLSAGDCIYCYCCAAGGNHGHSPRKPQEIINIPAKKLLDLSSFFLIS